MEVHVVEDKGRITVDITVDALSLLLTPVKDIHTFSNLDQNKMMYRVVAMRFLVIWRRRSVVDASCMSRL